MTTYNFQKQLEKGQVQEMRVEDFLRGRGWKVTQTDMSEQRRGIDRWLHNSMNPEAIGVEMKADFQAHRTGNAYIETVSVGRYVGKDFVVEKDGWLYTSQADYLFYLVVETGKLYLTTPKDRREQMETKRYHGVTVKNNGYQGRGLLLPLKELENISKRDWSID